MSDDRPVATALAVVAVVVLAAGATASAQPAHQSPVAPPTVQAAFAAEGYRAGSVATLIFFDRARDVTLRLRRVGYAAGIARPAAMRGKTVGVARRLGQVVPGRAVTIRTGVGWRSGLYFAELTAPGGRVGYAPFVLAPRRLGEHRIAVVLPTETWQAYNRRDDDGDGRGDTWYASATVRAGLVRPFADRGVPPHYRRYDEAFLRWLDRRRYPVDFLSDRDLRGATAASLAAAYRLLLFEGHHEYVTQHEYDAVRGFRDRGGNLIFLSANSFFWKISVAGGVMTRLVLWRKIGRDEAALVGAHYWEWDTKRRGGAPWVLRDTPASGWIFRGTGLRPGSRFSGGCCEADRTTPASPRNVQVVAEIPNVFGSGLPAQMTYYRAPSGAQVFAAGAFSLAASVWQPPVQIVVENLIRAFSAPT